MANTLLFLPPVSPQLGGGGGSPVSTSRQTASPSRVCKLTPMDKARALIPPVGQWPGGWQLHTLMVSVVVLDRAGDPLSATTTGRRYWVRSRRLKELLRATMLAVLSGIRRGGGSNPGKTLSDLELGGLSCRRQDGCPGLWTECFRPFFDSKLRIKGDLGGGRRQKLRPH